MAEITLKGNPFHTSGELPAVGSVAPAFTLVKSDLSEVTLEDLKGKKVILNIYPSVDTGTCATSTRTFNEKASSLDNTVVVCVSKDLPFAFGRFCGAEGIEKVITGSSFRDTSFEDAYGLKIIDGPLTGLCSRCIVVIDEEGKVKYTEQVAETVDEPNYEAAIAAL
ncbi:MULTISPECIES: thiol peroxidase [unclassified Flammeovirga]|uniref:thiol peroxidase n=1 Tax=unclassified Flammeovirga TaxID=2637820 RepID=UPI0005C7667D|nr:MULTISPECIES: thiol peroxidase [unclassified Flammeovirga]MBD0404099.1 thiol peroxidase [Flammeovirga sp. EKP202]